MKKILFTILFGAMSANSFAGSVESQTTIGFVLQMCLLDVDSAIAREEKKPNNAAKVEELQAFKQDVKSSANACSWNPVKMAPIKNNIIQKQPFRPDVCARIVKPVMCEPGADRSVKYCCNEQKLESGSTNVKSAPIEEKSYSDHFAEKQLKSLRQQAG